MVRTTAAPPGFLPVLAGYIAALLVLANIGDWSRVLMLGLLTIPLVV